MDFNVSGTASSPLTVQYTAAGDCSINANGKVHLQQPASFPGSCTITASQAVTATTTPPSPSRGRSRSASPSPPSVTITTAAASATYYQYQSIQADYSCQAAPGLSIASCTGPVNQGAPIDTATPGQHSFTVKATDSGNGQATKTVNYNVIAVGSPQNGSFVIGNRNASVGTNVTYWGAQWWKRNSLLGRLGPLRLQGLRDSVAGARPAAADLDHPPRQQLRHRQPAPNTWR